MSARIMIKMKLTAIVLTDNEETFLPNCLKSLAWADEILVIDAGSTDQTTEIAKKAGTRVVQVPWKGFPQQRNAGAKLAKGEFILYVDADERVSPQLREEIRELLRGKPPYASYRIPH